jgi:hypothetical protein
MLNLCLILKSDYRNFFGDLVSVLRVFEHLLMPLLSFAHSRMFCLGKMRFADFILDHRYNIVTVTL